MKLNWFSTEKTDAFARELAKSIVDDVSKVASGKGRKFSGKAEKALHKADVRLQAFKRDNSLNFYKRSRFANAFLWALKDAGCPEEYADELTQWLTLRL